MAERRPARVVRVADTNSLPAGSEFAGYRIDRLLGRGGMGAVYAAHHPRLPRLVALKLLHTSFSADPVFRNRFEREAQLAGRLDHPNIVAIHDRGQQDDQLWISMQYIEGHDAAAIASDGPLPNEQALHIVREIARALDYAHSAGLLHRDVKPANILLRARTSPEQVLLTDFGIAKSGDEASSLTETGTLMATLHYAAPEQLGGGPLGPFTDQYALACTLFRLLAGRAPFNAESTGGVITAHLMSPVPRITDLRPDLPRALDAVFERAMNKNPQLRFPSCTAMADAATAAARAQAATAAGPADTATAAGPANAATAAGQVPEHTMRASNRPGHPPQATVRGAPSFVPGPPYAASPPTAPPTSHRFRTPRVIGIAVIAVIAVVTIAAIVLTSRDSDSVGTGTAASGSTSTAQVTSEVAVADAAPDAWAAGRATISMFPDLLPADPDDVGYRDLRCAFATKNPDSSWEYGFTCSDPDGIDLQVLTHDGAASVAQYVAGLPAGSDLSLTSRYGVPLIVRQYNGSTGPWISVQFGTAPQSAVLFQVFWKGLSHQEIIDQWLLTAPM